MQLIVLNGYISIPGPCIKSNQNHIVPDFDISKCHTVVQRIDYIILYRHETCDLHS